MTNYFQKHVEYLHNILLTFKLSKENTGMFQSPSDDIHQKQSFINQWWANSCNKYCGSSSSSNYGTYTYTFFRSCEFTEYLLELKSKEFSKIIEEHKKVINTLTERIKLNSKSFEEEIK